MPDESKVIQAQILEQQNPVAPASFVSVQPEPTNEAVVTPFVLSYKKRGLPFSFKSLSLIVIVLFLLVGSVFVVSQLSLQKGSLDLRSRASKKEGSVLKNGSFEQNLLSWK